MRLPKQKFSRVLYVRVPVFGLDFPYKRFIQYPKIFPSVAHRQTSKWVEYDAAGI